MLGFVLPVVLVGIPLLVAMLMLLVGSCSLVARVLRPSPRVVPMPVRPSPALTQLPPSPAVRPPAVARSLHGPNTAFELDGLIAQLGAAPSRRSPARLAKGSVPPLHRAAPIRSFTTSRSQRVTVPSPPRVRTPSRDFDDEETQVFAPFYAG